MRATKLEGEFRCHGMILPQRPDNLPFTRACARVNGHRGRVARGEIPFEGPDPVPSWLVDRVNPALLAYVLHLPPSAVSLVSDYRFRRSAQRLARLTL